MEKNVGGGGDGLSEDATVGRCGGDGGGGSAMGFWSLETVGILLVMEWMESLEESFRSTVFD